MKIQTLWLCIAPLTMEAPSLINKSMTTVNKHFHFALCPLCMVCLFSVF